MDTTDAMTFRRHSRAARAALALAVLPLAGCGQGLDLDRTLGLETPAPDEFKVSDHAPLTMPPSFELPEPKPGARRPQATSPRQRAEEAVLTASARGARAGGAGGLSDGERTLLTKAGSQQATEDIRDTLARENDSFYADDDLLNFNNLVWWREPAPKGTIVDASAESKRIRENRALGRPLTQGETPTVEPKERALLEGIF
jgi:hypothetical protein